MYTFRVMPDNDTELLVNWDMGYVHSYELDSLGDWVKPNHVDRWIVERGLSKAAHIGFIGYEEAKKACQTLTTTHHGTWCFNKDPEPI